MENNEFEPGKQYSNRRGSYTVLELRGTKMLVRYEDGVTSELTIGQQSNILRNIREEAVAKITLDAVALRAAARAAAKAPKGPKVPKAPKAPKAPKSEAKKADQVGAPVRGRPKSAAKAAKASPVTTAEPSNGESLSVVTDTDSPVHELLTNNADAPLFKADAIRVFTQFKGFGNPLGNVWFIGMEEISDLGTVELKRRLDLEIFEESYADFQELMRLEAKPNLLQSVTPALKVMAYAGLRFSGQGKTFSYAEQENYFSSSFGTSSGNVLVSSLLPLPVPDTNEWPYDNIQISDNSMLQRHLRDRKLYLQMFLPERISLFQSIYQKRKENKTAPRYILAYGKRSWSHYRKLFPLSYVETALSNRSDGSTANLMLGRDNESGTWVILVGTMNDVKGDVTNHLCDQLAERLEQFER